MRIEDLQDPSKPFATYYKNKFFISYEINKNDCTFIAYYFDSCGNLDYTNAGRYNYRDDILLHESMDITNNHAEITKLLKKLPKQFPELAL